ncbi:PorV/PorQ family protein [candidate division KSB1 bacterium]|nr:PorV/PorQ family protein [candidate division KSB1 bacterium]
MEKIYTCEIREKSNRFIFLVVIFLLSQWHLLFGQVRSGAAFLSNLPGARVQAQAGNVTAGLDDIHVIYANPGALGFARDWQWAASYSKWIADIYIASLLYGTRVLTPWSRRTRFSFGVHYQGMPEFDSSDGLVPRVMADDVLFTAGIGQPLTFITPWLSTGANVKYLRSRLDFYDASSWSADFGVLARTPKFKFIGPGFFEYGIVSGGFAVNNVGQPLTFVSAETPLPQSIRGGLAFNTGSHNSFSLQLSLDYIKIKDENSRVGVGTEIAWNHLFALTAGYNSGYDLMSKYSFGLSVILDSRTSAINNVIPGRNNAMRFDVASMDDEDDFFARTYRGSISHYPVGPEKFTFIYPANGDSIKTDTATLEWSKSNDPDMYDDVVYYLLVDHDSLKIDRVLNNCFQQPHDIPRILLQDSLIVGEKSTMERYRMGDFSGGVYHWAVIAADKDYHLKFANIGRHRIARFYVPLPDVFVSGVQFDYNPWITSDDLQGNLLVNVMNAGLSVARSVSVVLYDSSAENMETPKLIIQKTIEEISPGEVQAFIVEWFTLQHGYHYIKSHVDQQNIIRELNEDNNLHVSGFYTIPKGVFTTSDTTDGLYSSTVLLELPIINEVFMDPNSSRVKVEYLYKTILVPPLATMANRLKKNPELQLKLKGYADPNSEQASVKLAEIRAGAVRDSVLSTGVNPEQVESLGGEVWPRRTLPANQTDARWILEERRVVKTTAKKEDQLELFSPIPHLDVENLRKPVDFTANIYGVVPAEDASVNFDYYQGNSTGDVADIRPLLSDSLSLPVNSTPTMFNEKILWQPQAADSAEYAAWLNKDITYALTVMDTLGRVFRTHPAVTFVTTKNFTRQYRISFPLQFASSQPLYNFYWPRIYTIAKELFRNPKMRIRFVGHACATGPEAVNKRLSLQRARDFHKGFLQFLKIQHPEDYDGIMERLDEPDGFGEGQPLSITRYSGDVVLFGDNDDPIGRKLNRRIEIVFSLTVDPLESLRLNE